MSELDYDVIVVGAGNAALAAATAASQAGAKRVVVLEKAPEHMRGGNTHYSGGLFRIAFDDPDLDIEWAYDSADLIMSDRDRHWPRLRDLDASP